MQRPVNKLGKDNETIETKKTLAERIMLDKVEKTERCINAGTQGHLRWSGTRI